MSDVRLSMTWRQWMESMALSSTLKEILLDVLSRWPDEDPNDTAEVTDVHRSAAEDKAVGGSGIHVSGPPYRAIDLRNKDWGPDHQAKAEALAKVINNLWIYDPARPSKLVCMVAPHGTGPHLHLQCHSATRRRSIA